MTGREPWVGDQVHDGHANREGVITDVKKGTYVLRPLGRYSGGTWPASDPAQLTVTVPREERLREWRQAWSCAAPPSP